MKKYLKENVKSTWIRRLGARESRVEKVGSRARFEIRAISVPCAWCRSRESETRIGNRTREGDGRWERRACTIEASLSWTSKRFCVLPWRGVSSRAIMPSNSNRNYASDYVFPFILETLKCFVLIKTIYLFIFFFHLNLKEISSIVWRGSFKVFYQEEEFQLIYFVIIYFTVTMIIRYTCCSFPECNVKSLNFIFSSLHSFIFNFKFNCSKNI